MKKSSLIFLCFFVQAFIFAQRGKDGTVTIGAGTSIVNVYTSLTANAASGATALNVANSAGYTPGDLVYIIQMQGASVNCFSNIWGNPNSPEPYSSAFGRITNYNNAGNNEYAQVASVAGNVINLDCGLKFDYTSSGKVQVIKVPRYAQLTVTGTITCPAWNGTTGGVIAIEVLGNTTINPTGRIDASNLGFRGGMQLMKTQNSFGGASWGHNNKAEGSLKGESIAGDTTLYFTLFNGKYCKGAVANGGGGGNSVNAGGGGGANGGDTALYNGNGNPDISVAGYITAWNLESAGFSANTSSGGGRGGYTFSSANLSPLTNGPNLGTWSGDSRRNEGGKGGRPLNYNTGRLFLGGGGGAGDEDNLYGSAGGDGGGIIDIVSYGNISGGGQILANGEQGANTNTTVAPPFNNANGRDGAGGGGGGGAIRINSAGTITSLTVAANGGNGGNQQMVSNFLSNTPMAYGPGGGGSGGYIGTTGAVITTSVLGGANGIMKYVTGAGATNNENCQIDNLFPPNGATRGGAGSVTATLTALATVTASGTQSICANNSATLIAGTTGTGSINWYNAAAGGSLLGTGSPFTTSVIASAGVYTVYAGTCPAVPFRVPVTITVSTSPTITAVSQTICSGQTATVTASGASTYLWNTGATTASVAVSPASTTVYTVTGNNGGCAASITTTVHVNTGGTITVNSATICNGQTAILTAGSASSYTWNTGANTVSISVGPGTTTTYSVNATNASGCVLSNTAQVTVNTTPTVTAGNATLCSGQSATLTATGATSYSWNTGATSASIAVNPPSTLVYTVVGTTGTCTNMNTATVNVNTTPTVSVNSSTICSGNNATLTAGGAATYSWNTGSTSSSISAGPSSTTVYTVTGTNGNCSDTRTATITVNTTPTVTVNSSTICSGASATLTANGASSYSWNTGATSAVLNPTPTSTTVYTVTGTTGNCYDIKTATVSVNTSPTVSVNSSTICSGNSATLSANGATSYSWNTGAVTTSISSSPAVTTVYTVTGTSGNCSHVRTATITVNTTPTISVNSATVCPGNSVTITASGASTYSWNTGATTASISVSPVTTTTYSVTGANGSCSASAISTINVNSVGSITVNTASICSGQTATLNAGTASSYTWNTGANTQAITVSPVTNTTYTINATNASGCLLTNTTNVIVNTTPTLTANSTTLCSGQTTTLTVTGAATYSWSNGGTSNNIVVSPPSSTSYTVVGSNSSCTSSATASVNVTSTPTLSVNSPSICAGNTTIITAGGASTYSWNTGATTSSISVNPAGTTVYSVTGFNGTCQSTASTTVNVTSAPTVSLNSSSFVICTAQSASLIATSSTGTYTWNTGANSSSIIVSPAVTTVYTVTSSNNCGTAAQTATVSVSSTPAFTIVPTSTLLCNGQAATLTTIGSTGSFTWSTGATTNTITTTLSDPITATVSNACGSSPSANTVTFVTEISPSPTITSSSSTLCAGNSVTLTANSTGSLSWSVGSATTSAITVSNTGVYSLTATNQCGSSSTSYTINNGPAPNVNINSAGSFCSGQTATLIASGASTYTWNTGTSGSILTTSAAGIYTATGENNCGTNTQTFNVVFSAAPSVSLTASDYTICPGETSTLTANGLNGGPDYSWFDFPANSGSVQTVSSAGNYLVTYTNSCGTSTAAVAIVQSTLTPGFAMSANSGISPLTVNFTNTSINNNSNLWDFGNGQTSSNVNENNVTYNTSGIYTVSLLITSPEGCTSVVSQTLEVLPGEFGPIPEVITPNGDGKNEVLHINGIERYGNNELTIFNRWGHQVYRMKGYTNSNGWDGKPNFGNKNGGDKLPAGTYFYILNLNDSSGTAYRGFIQLMY